MGKKTSPGRGELDSVLAAIKDTDEDIQKGVGEDDNYQWNQWDLHGIKNVI